MRRRRDSCEESGSLAIGLQESLDRRRPQAGLPTPTSAAWLDEMPRPSGILGGVLALGGVAIVNLRR